MKNNNLLEYEHFCSHRQQNTILLRYLIKKDCSSVHLHMRSVAGGFPHCTLQPFRAPSAKKRHVRRKVISRKYCPSLGNKQRNYLLFYQFYFCQMPFLMSLRLKLKFSVHIVRAQCYRCYCVAILSISRGVDAKMNLCRWLAAFSVILRRRWQLEGCSFMALLPEELENFE